MHERRKEATMRDREQRLRWIEKLIGGARQTTERKNALVVPSTEGDLTIAFEVIEELVAAKGVQHIAFLSDEYCGVLHRGNKLAPVIDIGGNESELGHVVLVKSGDRLLGLMFRGTPYVVDLEETEHTASRVSPDQASDCKAFPLLDVEALVERLLAKE